jgi:SpoVK/Ycf46/Vps4 family AAA+-type ATPase
LPFGVPDVAARGACWRASLSAYGFEAHDADLDLLARRFRVTPGQIADAVSIATAAARWRAASKADANAEADAPLLSMAAPTLAELLAATRAQSTQALAALAEKVTPVATWDDIVLPDDARAQLRELCQRVDVRDRVLSECGFGRKLSRGLGVSALFVGPSGTGKTMAAEVVAAELGLDLYRIDLAMLVSKYIGETEKNLDRVFTAAEQANAILFFDEADALFGKRSEVRDSHDRYANLEVSYLLQKMEEYDGLAILATNLRQNVDEAFVRRLAFTVAFPFPDAEDRLRIWRGIWPPALSIAPTVRLHALAERFALSGGNIKNVALAAAFLAAGDGGMVEPRHLAQAVRREYQKMGKLLTQDEVEAALLEGPA